ncbi:Peptidyl-prolyl cis-trans isomerase ppiB [Candidatus Methylocalor cossyra]|uniref:Peptidyl-prolyl cis-trans isomerase n=1 Tax=Candidatus Methylocalor cossyra TaxID=3108543 RepID=A0ABM9NH77_9GAMM
MKPLSVCLFLGILIPAMTGGAAENTHPTEKPPVSETSPQVKFETNLGDIVVTLNPSKAPVTVENFLAYVKEGFYDGTLFHRVIPGFMAQGGGFTKDFQPKPTHPPIKNEADNGLPNKRGTIAMARSSDPNSATAQFFINFKDNAFLDYRNPTPQGWGYAVFGEVTQGMDVVDKMATIPTGAGGPMPSDVPKHPIVIEKATVLRP